MTSLITYLIILGMSVHFFNRDIYTEIGFEISFILTADKNVYSFQKIKLFPIKIEKGLFLLGYLIFFLIDIYLFLHP